MNYASYQAFRIGMQWLIEGDELTDTFSVNTLDLIIGLGEGRVYLGDAQTTGLRASSMLTTATLTVTDNAVTLPADLLELREVHVDGSRPVEVIPLDRLRQLLTGGSAGDARYAAQHGDTLIFWPEASGTVDVSYFKRPEALQTVTWANATTFARYPELFTYACLFEAALFLGMNEKMPIWEGRYRQLADGANHAERMRVYGGSPLTVRTR